MNTPKILKNINQLGLAVRGTALAMGTPTLMIAGSAIGLASDVGLKIVAARNEKGDLDLQMSLVELHQQELDLQEAFRQMDIEQQLSKLRHTLYESIPMEILEDRKQIAKRMLSDGISADKIALYTQLLPSDIEAL